MAAVQKSKDRSRATEKGLNVVKKEIRTGMNSFLNSGARGKGKGPTAKDEKQAEPQSPMRRALLCGLLAVVWILTAIGSLFMWCEVNEPPPGPPSA